MMWDLWWVWMAGAVALGILELFAPGFVFVGFAIGAALVGVLLALGVGASLPWLLVIFAVISVIAWVVMRQVFGLKGGNAKTFDHDIND